MQDFFKNTNREILEKEYNTLALIFPTSMDVINKAKKELIDIQVKKNFKSQQKKEQRVQINYNNLKRQRNEILGWLIVISTHIGRASLYFVDDPIGNTDSKIQEFVEKTEKENLAAVTRVHEEERSIHKRKPK